jgi:hypothetical protein
MLVCPYFAAQYRKFRDVLSFSFQQKVSYR